MTLQSPYVRDEYSDKVLGELRLPEFRLVKEWVLSEWVDGVPVKIQYLSANGTTQTTVESAAAVLLDISGMVDDDRFLAAFGSTPVTFYGVAYGDGVKETPAHYCAGVRLRIHDALVNLQPVSPSTVEKLVEKVGLWSTTTIEQVATLDEARYIARQGLRSYTAYEEGGPGGPLQGVVGRTDPILCTGTGERLQFLLQSRDF